MSSNLPNIFQYTDFRKFIADSIDYHRKNDANFSNGRFCEKLGIPNTRSYLNNVIHGRKVTETFQERFIKVFCLSGMEAHFFRLLVSHNQTEDRNIKEFYARLLTLCKMPQAEFARSAFSVLHGNGGAKKKLPKKVFYEIFEADGYAS